MLALPPLKPAFAQDGSSIRSIVSIKKSIVSELTHLESCFIVATGHETASLHFLTHASFAEEPSRHSDQEHHNDGRLIFHVAHNVHRLPILASIASSSSIIRLILGPTSVVVDIVVSVRIVGRKGRHVGRYVYEAMQWKQ